MANRSYLYAADHLPTPDVATSVRRQVGISEWRYDIPIAYKLLVSANTQQCISSIWSTPETIAIGGDYDGGTDRLFAFLDHISNPAIVPLRDEARLFLSSSENRRRYFVLECGEIFEMNDGSPAEQNELLFLEICRLAERENTISATSNPPPAKQGLLSRLFNSKQAKEPPVIDADSLGLGCWSSVLRYDPNA